MHAYQYGKGHSTFVVETTEAAWRKARSSQRRRHGRNGRASSRTSSRDAKNEVPEQLLAGLAASTRFSTVQSDTHLGRWAPFRP